MHRKSYEFTQLLYGLRKLGCLDANASVLSVGAGHECVLYWLANHVGRVVATDTYDGRWQSEGAAEGDGAVIDRPEVFAPFPYRADRLSFRRMDGRALDLPANSFDVVYSLSSIEHFGGFTGAQAAITEMARVLKPGGVMAVATEYIVSGPSYEEAFHADDIHALCHCPGLRLVAPIDERVYDRYRTRPVDLRQDINQRPHMLVRIDETIFTSVMMFFEKKQ
jgi:SAM-dependent methyltransferase